MNAYWYDTGVVIDEGTLTDEGIEFMTVTAREVEPVVKLLMEERGYVARDEVTLSREQPDFKVIRDKFNKEHSHSEDEVRLVLSGGGVFDVRTRDDRWMRIIVRTGDLIVVPAQRHH